MKVSDKVVLHAKGYEGKTGVVIDTDPELIPGVYPITVFLTEDGYEMCFRESEVEVTA